MSPRQLKLGDVVDDYCPRCRLVMNHGIMALDGASILKVQCTTCLNDHPYRHGKIPKKKDPLKSAYDELLAKIPGGGPRLVPPPKPTEPPEDDE